MVSIRRRRLQGLSTVPKTFDGGQTPGNARQCSKPFCMNHLPSIDLDQVMEVCSANAHKCLVDGVIAIENSDLRIDLKAISLLLSKIKAARDQYDKLRDDITQEVRTNGYIRYEKQSAISDSQTKLKEEFTSLEDQIRTTESELDAILALLYQRMGENSTK